MPPTVYLLDGHALAYRAYFALTRGDSGGFSTSSGEPTAGIFGFTSILLRILEQDRPEYLIVAFDTGKTFRDTLYPAYKATRAKMPDDLRPQMERIRQLVDTFNIPRLEIEGYEADDILGSAACQLAAQGYGVKIITGDKDLLQLVTERVLVNLSGKSLGDAKDYFPQHVKEYLGVRPDQIVDYKALVGDKSDNIPGVAGIGEKTAVLLLEQFDSLDGIYAHLDEIAAGMRKKLEASRQDAILSQKLATIVTDLNIAIDLDMARTEHFDPKQVESLFRELEFRTLLQRLTAIYPLYGKTTAPQQQQLSFLTPHTPPSPTRSAQPVPGEIAAQIIDSPEALQSLVSRLQSATWIAFDTETTSTNEMQAQLVGISLATDGQQGYYIPVGHQPLMGNQLPLNLVLDALRSPLTDPNIPKAGHNLKYDYVLLARHGLRVAPLSFDTMIAEWLCNPASRNLGLKNLAWVRLDLKMTEIEALIGTGKNQVSMAEGPIADAASYAAADAAAVLRLMPILKDEMQVSHVTHIFQEIEMPLVSILAEMEMAGIALDSAFLSEISHELNTRMTEIEGQVFQQVGESFNLNSTQQLAHALFERLKLPPPGRTRRTASGHYSTSAEVLEALSGKHPVVDLILEYRELSKLKSTYVDALPQQVNPLTGRVHTSYNQTGSVTGRIASSDPNLQNIPIRTELGRQVRRAFIPYSGNRLLSVDYSQVELRIAAHMANDSAMLAAFQAGQDIHTATAAAIYNIPLEAVTKVQRRHAKSINFGLIYGMSAYGLTRSSELTLAEAEDFVEAYFRQFPGIKRYLDQVRQQASAQGHVETLLGRRRYFPELRTQGNLNIRNRQEREAINAPIQGTAADIMKIAMLHVHRALKDAGLSARMLLQVHDELVLECPTSEVETTARLVCKVMENAYALNAPLRTEARQGLNWGEMDVIHI
ncbi:MAG: DNA polymerase I [Anaerolineales bacterium]|nr:DNA polymerase I [Anaerolineales bacterium]